MRGNGKVFISHAHDDNDRCAPLLAALDAWGVDYWFDTRRMEAGDDLSHAIQRAIAERDLFLRICTPAAQRSYWVRLETGAFRGLQARQHRAGGDTTRVLINLILDPAYEPEPFDYAHIFIDATSKPRRGAAAPRRSEESRAWLDELRRALGVAAPSTAPPPPDEPADGPITYIVDHSGLGDYTTIAAALRAAHNGDRIVIRPGRYPEALVVDTSLSLVGEGGPGAVTIEAGQASALRIEAPNAQVQNLTIRQSGSRDLDCLVIAAGKVEVIGCDISAQTAGACVNLAGRDEVLLRGNRIHDGGGWGVFAGGTGIVTLEDNEISAHAGSGVTVMRDAYVIAQRNRIVRNAQHAIRISAGGGGAFEDNDLRGNYLATWDIDPSSFGKVLRERNKG
ncbi:MAG TPA: TIR domain-containing protein [Ktedonobacterales bacterium]|nr:TIR domain-containing protein [Ktedonobacterales bacterium]